MRSNHTKTNMAKEQNRNYMKWLQREFECHDPGTCAEHVLEALKSETLASEAFMMIAGLSLIADGCGDKKGARACEDTLRVLANTHMSNVYVIKS